MAVKNTIAIPYSTLESADKWLVNYFMMTNQFDDSLYCNSVKLRDLVKERNESIDPQRYQNWPFAYLGLENIEPHTGFLVNFKKVNGLNIKSRCKIFYGGDILYGKLRPSLNKVLYVHPDFKAGICSTEVFVLQTDVTKIHPRVLRFLLASDFVLNQILSYTAGAALPRIHIKDFLNIDIPIPKKNVMTKLESDLRTLENEIMQSRSTYLNSNHLFDRLFQKYINENEGQKVYLYKNETEFIGSLPT